MVHRPFNLFDPFYHLGRANRAHGDVGEGVRVGGHGDGGGGDGGGMWNDISRNFPCQWLRVELVCLVELCLR